MKAKDIKWCPQHGYPLPCDKCGMPLSRPQQKEIYESGKQVGRREVVEWIGKQLTAICPEEKHECDLGDFGRAYETEACHVIYISEGEWQAKLKEWGI